MNKKIKSLALLPLLMILFCGCQSTSDSLEVNPKIIAFTEQELTVNFDITTNAKWEVTCSETWLKCTPDNGEGNRNVRVTAFANNQSATRTGSITVTTSQGKNQTIQVTQPGLEQFINIDPASASVESSGGDVSVWVSASAEWTPQIPDETKAWITIKSQTAVLAVFSIANNTSENGRTAVINFRMDGSGTQIPFTLSQKGYIEPMTINPMQESLSYESDEVTVNVNTVRTWEATIPPTDTWVTVKQKTDNSIVFSVEENQTGIHRTSNIAFQQYGDENVVTFVLSQGVDYELMTTLNPTASQLGFNYTALHNWMSGFGFDYTEHPYCTGRGGHMDGTHIDVEWDEVLQQHVFRFDIHIDPVIDGDRCGAANDRQRNEMKSATNNSPTAWAKVQGNWDEWQLLEWKFKIPVGFQPTGSFCHIHQLKAQDGSNNGNPLITITPRANSNGTNKRMQIIHTVDGANPSAGMPNGLGTVVDNIPLADFEGEWVQVVEEVHYRYNGYFSIKITRISDGKVLLSYERNNINMWRSSASYIRNKFGIYRSLAGGDLLKNPVGQSALLKNESIWLCDLKIYEKNTNPNPQTPVTTPPN